MAVNRYVDTSATYNGDGTTAAQASGDGLTGAYNSIATALANAPNNPSSGSEWDIWVRRLSSDISITAQLSPANDGSYNAPHRLIGWPFRVQHTGYTVDSVPSGTDNLGFNNAQWQFVDSALTEGDNYWIGAEVEFTSGNNNGLKRMVIWFDATNDTVYLDFPLPNDIAASDQYTITLETEEYSNRPQSGIDEGWDSDTKVRPFLDGGGGSFDLLTFNNDDYWHLYNFTLKQSSAYRVVKVTPMVMKNIVVDDCGNSYSSIGYSASTITKYMNKIFILSGSTLQVDGIVENTHVNKGSVGSVALTGNSNGSSYPSVLKNVTTGRISSFSSTFGAYVSKQVIGENVLFGETMRSSSNSYPKYAHELSKGVSFSGYQGDKDKFYIGHILGEIYNADEDGTINPPSGAMTYIKITPSSHCNDEYQLHYEEQRYQSSGSKTYTWKIYPTGWSGLSTSDIELEAWYLDESTGTHRAITTANPSSVTNDSWNDLSITVNPSQAGTVYFILKLKRYEASAYIALDPEPSIE